MASCPHRRSRSPLPQPALGRGPQARGGGAEAARLREVREQHRVSGAGGLGGPGAGPVPATPPGKAKTRGCSQGWGCPRAGSVPDVAPGRDKTRLIVGVGGAGPRAGPIPAVAAGRVKMRLILRWEWGWGLGGPRAGSILVVAPTGQKWGWSWRVSGARAVPGQDPPLPALRGHDGSDPGWEGTLVTHRVPRVTPCPHTPRTQAVRIQDGRYRHPTCYTCADCGLSLKMRGHFWVGDELFCEKHARLRYQGPPGGPVPRPVSPRS